MTPRLTVSAARRLSRRLGAIRKGNTDKPAAVDILKPKRPPRIVPDIPGWNQVAPMVYSKTSTITLDRPELIEASPLIKYIFPLGDLSEARIESYRFFDLETTGLSRGAGTVAFLAGVGRFMGDQFELTQLFLSDYPGEPDFLDELARLMPSDTIWVSYNGKSFDTSLLRTRFLMNRKNLQEGLQLDLLYPSRRLWRRILEDCSLGNVEKEILLKLRSLDIPGAEIPDRYLEFLKDGQFAPLEPVMAHHAEDIITLAVLLPLIEGILAGERMEIPRDLLGLGKILLSINHDGVENILAQGARSGDNKCAIELGLYLKRGGRFEDAQRVWLDLWERSRSIRAAREMAIHLEHRLSDFQKALTLVDAVLNGTFPPRGDLKAEWEHRASRLRVKITRFGL